MHYSRVFSGSIAIFDGSYTSFPRAYSWVSRDVINFTGGQLQINTQSSEENNSSLYVWILCLAANMCNFV